MTHEHCAESGEQRRRRAARTRAAIRDYFVGQGAAGHRSRFAYESLVWWFIVTGAFTIFFAAAFGIGITVGIGHEEALARFHGWMVATPVAQLQQTVEAIAWGVIRDAACGALFIAPIIVLKRIAKGDPSE